MKNIRNLLLTIPLIFIVGCSSANINSNDVSKEAIQKNTMTKVQNDVNVIMDKSYDYVLENMGEPYSTIYSLKINNVDDFKDIKEITKTDDIKVLSTGLLYPKYTSDYKLDGSAVYIGLKDKQVDKVETCDFKNFDVSQVKDKDSNVVILKYNDYDSLDIDSVDELKTYVGQEKSSISDIIKHKKTHYSIYSDIGEDICVEIYNLEDDNFLIMVVQDDQIIYLDEEDCSDLLDTVENDINK